MHSLEGLIHGYSNKPDSAPLINDFNLFNAGLKCRIHFEYVESKANVADLPSRNAFLYLTDVLGSRFVPTDCLEAATWEGPLQNTSWSFFTFQPRLAIREPRKRHRRAQLCAICHSMLSSPHMRSPFALGGMTRSRRCTLADSLSGASMRARLKLETTERKAERKRHCLKRFLDRQMAANASLPQWFIDEEVLTERVDDSTLPAIEG